MWMQVALFAALFTLASGAINFSEPILATDYVNIIGQGFSTNYFKTKKPLSRYKEQNIVDLLDAGFTNLRLRCRSGLFPATDDEKFLPFLVDLKKVVEDMLRHGAIPIISWIGHDAEAYATEQQRVDYVLWWKRVAEYLKDIDYRLSFNLFTELGYTGCEPDNYCPDSLRENPDKYDAWTRAVVDEIRNLTGNNKERILILASPLKTAEGLYLINESIYDGDSYMMVEWHIYASGPNQNCLNNGKPSAKYWSGTGSECDKQRVKDHIAVGANYSAVTGLPSYFGAWMTMDNIDGVLSQCEVNSFGCYFAEQLKLNNIPWSMNVYDDFYDTKTLEWLTDLQEIPKGTTNWLNMSMVLEEFKPCM